MNDYNKEKNSGKSKSDTDFNIRMDVDMEIEKNSKKKINENKISENEMKPTEREPRVYDQEASQSAIGRLVAETERSSASVKIPKDAKTPDAESTDMTYIDYINRTSSLNKKEEEEKNRQREILQKERTNMTVNVKAPARSAIYAGELEPKENIALRKSIRINEKIDETYSKNHSEAYSELYADDGQDDESVADSLRVSEIKYVLAGALIIILLLFVFLIFQINKTKDDLKEANAKIESYAKLTEQMNPSESDGWVVDEELRTLVDELSVMNEGLKAQIASLESQLNINTNPDNPPDSPPPDTTTPNPPESTPPPSQSTPTPPQSTPTPPASGQTYTAKDGDTFWRIAEMFYNNGARYTDIMAANGITNENGLKDGMTIIIP